MELNYKIPPEQFDLHVIYANRFNLSLCRYAKVSVAHEGQRFVGDGIVQGPEQRSHHRDFRVLDAKDYK